MHLHTVRANGPQQGEDIGVVVEVFSFLHVRLYPRGIGTGVYGKLPLPHLPTHTSITGKTESLHQQVHIMVLIILTEPC